MSHEINFLFQYTPSEIYSAHRLRFWRSSQFRTVAIIGLLAEAFLVAQQLFPQALNKPAGSTWTTPIAIGILMIVLPFTIYLFVPLIHYRFNADWKKTFRLFLSKEAFRIEEASGDKPGVPIKWFHVKRVVEDRRVIVLILSSDRFFVIIPKRLFENREQEAFLRKVLAKRASTA